MGEFAPAADANIVEAKKAGRVQGGRGLKDTQTYPKGFGEAVRSSWAASEPRDAIEARMSVDVLRSPAEASTGWELADLDETLAHVAS